MEILRSIRSMGQTLWIHTLGDIQTIGHTGIGSNRHRGIRIWEHTKNINTCRLSIGTYKLGDMRTCRHGDINYDENTRTSRFRGMNKWGRRSRDMQMWGHTDLRTCRHWDIYT